MSCDDDGADHQTQCRRRKCVDDPRQYPADSGDVTDCFFAVMNGVVERVEAQFVDADQQDVATDPQHRGGTHDREH